MTFRPAVPYLLAFLMLAVAAHSAAAQEILSPARIQARTSRRQPSLGLPKRLDGQHDPAVWFVALCKKTRSDLGWKSISFVIPPEGLPAGSNIWNHSHSVNWLEHNIGYNLFPNLPPHIQDIIEEITAAELICPFQEFDPGLADTPDQEIDYDWEFDYRDI